MKTNFTRRSLLLASAILLPLAACSAGPKPQGQTGIDPFTDDPWRKLTDQEWKQRLSTEAYQVLRHEATERPFTSALNDEKRPGIFHCNGCDLALFSSDTKFDSGTGWPSFFDALPGALGTKPDNSLIYVRTEYHCARCLGHQGHVFDDGPEPTGLRYCNNGVALVFKPA